MDCDMKNRLINFTKYFFLSQNVQHAAQKNITVENNKIRMNITNFINRYTNIYTYIVCDENDSK